jgi:murein DD-endopeptidase MepM/ murein hydrolase activator NlpD
MEPSLGTVAPATPLERRTARAVKQTSRLLDTVASTMSGMHGRFRWPVKGAVNTPFGGGHDGIDIEGETGDLIVATRAGKVVFAGDDGDGYGTKIVINHGRGIKSLYSHLNEIKERRGWVDAGEVVGTVGCTGSCSGDHLHFEILRDDRALNPLDFLPRG